VATAIRRSVEQFAAQVERDGAVLDVGCGLRPYEECFPHCSYLGIDVEESGRSAVDKKPDVYFNGVDIPCETERFDAAICTEVLEHCVHPDRLLAEIHRVLKPGGRLCLTVPFMWGEHEAPFDFRRYSRFGIEREFQRAGFEIERMEKLKRGVDAIEMLVASEVNNYEVNVLSPAATTTARLTRTARRAVTERVWRLQLRLWRGLYDFERIYVDNLVVGVKGARPGG
jgi:SAM-dependent methyltransferase